MKHRLFSRVLSVLLCVLLLSTTVYAEPLENPVDSLPEQTQDNTADTEARLVELLAAQEEVIYITADIQLTSTLYLSAPVALAAPEGATIPVLSGNETFALINAGNNALSLYNLKLTGGCADVGGHITDSEKSGGLVALNSADFYAYNCEFSDATAMSGNGGGVYGWQSMEFVGCTFSNLTAGQQGGVVYSAGNITLTDCDVENCYAGWYGGVVYSIAGNITLTDSTFTNVGCTSSGSGGGVAHTGSGSITATRCSVSGSKALGTGGALSAPGATAVVTATDCTFSNVFAGAMNGTSGTGGAIYLVDGALVMTRCSFVSCAAQWGPCAFVQNGTISGTNIMTQDCVDGGGAGNFAAWNPANVTVTLAITTEADLRAALAKGESAYIAADITLTEGPLVLTAATTLSAPADRITITGDKTSCLILAGGNALTVENINFVDGQATAAGGWLEGACYSGGAICAQAADVTIKNCSFTDCDASANGGAVYSWQTVLINDSTFVNCDSGWEGGAVYTAGYTHMENVQATNCTSTSGGFFRNVGGVPNEFINCTFTNCRVAELGYVGTYRPGGVFSIEAGSIYCKDCLADSCIGSSGVIFTNHASIVLDHLSIKDCVSLDGNDYCVSVDGTMAKSYGIYKEADLDRVTWSCYEGYIEDDIVLTASHWVTEGSAGLTFKNGGETMHTITSNGANGWIGASKVGAITFKGLKIDNCYNDCAIVPGGSLSAFGGYTVVTYEDCVISNNHSAAVGGAGYVEGKLVMKNCEVYDNGSFSAGGAFSVIGDIELTDCTFTRNAAGTTQLASGGVFQCFGGGSVTATNCAFYENHATCHGGVFAGNTAGDCALTLKDCTFSGNYGVGFGGVAWTFGYVDVEGCTFSENHADTKGGVFYVEPGNDVDIRNSEFSLNYAGAFGGAIWLDGNLNASDTTFRSNTAITAPGGAIYCQGSEGGLLYFERCDFDSNNAASETAGVGGGIFSNGTATMEAYDTVFQHNRAKLWGAAGGVDGGVYTENCVFYDNKLADEVTSIDFYSDFGEVENINSGTFAYNDAELHAVVDAGVPVVYLRADIELGSLLVANAGDLKLASWPKDETMYKITGDDTFSLIVSSSEDGYSLTLEGLELSHGLAKGANEVYVGGAVFIDQGDLTINNCYFHDNDSYNGGAIQANTGDVVITNSIFEDNQTATSGAALFVTGAAGKVVSIQKTDFMNNAAGYAAEDANGAAVSVAGLSDITIDGCYFDNNTLSTGSGGTIGAPNSNLTIIASTITKSSAPGVGGAILNNNGDLWIDNSVISSNRASVFAGGAVFHENGSVKVTNSKFLNNVIDGSDGGGGAIYDHSANLTILDSSFIGNKTTTDWIVGGAVSVKYIPVGVSPVITVERCYFEGQTLGADGATGVGACLFFEGGEATVNDCIFKDNTSAWGPAIAGSANVTVNNPTFDGNVPDTPEGQAYSDAPGTCVINNANTLTLAGHSVELGAKIGLNFYYKISEAIASDPTVKAHMTWQDGEYSRSKNIPSSQWAVEAGPDGTYYVFNVGMTAANMTCPATIQFFAGDTPISTLGSYSVFEYGEAALRNANDPTYAAVQDIVVAMLNYGGYAQSYFGINPDELANDILGEELDLSWIDDAWLDEYELVKSGEVEGVRVAGNMLELSSAPVSKLIFAFEDGYLPEDYSYVDSVDGELDYEKFDEFMDGFFACELAPAAANELTKAHVITISDTITSMTVKISPLTYAYQVLNADNPLIDDAMMDMMRAMYAYAIAANAYFG